MMLFIVDACSQETPRAATVVESLEALKASDEVELQIPSEVSGVQLVLCKSQKVYLVSMDKDRTLGKYCQLGGYGAGQYAKVAESGEGVPFELPEGDRSQVQLDECSLRDNTPTGQVATMTLYKLLVLLEREKAVTSHKMSYFKVCRKTEVEAGSDAFNLEQTEQMTFKIIPEKEDAKVTCKTFFAKCVNQLQHSQHLRHIFRFRFEKVGLCLKLQKPYVVTASPISLQKLKPVLVLDAKSS